ncbi:MAG: hypothetical protein M1836_006418 [Candelina mexicana]|nr:MAG: hypothetical protein M1836_006418 [Candelina mexicana]
MAFTSRGLITSPALLDLYQQAQQSADNSVVGAFWEAIFRNERARELVRGDAQLSLFIIDFDTQTPEAQAEWQARTYCRRFLQSEHSHPGRSDHVYMVIAIGTRARCMTISYPDMNQEVLGPADVYRDSRIEGAQLKARLDICISNASYVSFGGLIEERDETKRNALNKRWQVVQDGGSYEADTRSLWQFIITFHYPDLVYLTHEQHPVEGNKTRIDGVVIRHLRTGDALKLIWIEFKRELLDADEGRRDAERQASRYCRDFLAKPENPDSTYAITPPAPE